MENNIPSENEEPLIPIDEENEKTEYSSAESRHMFGGWTVGTQPVTRVDGKRVRMCYVCGETESEVVAHTILTVETITYNVKDCGDAKLPE